LVRPTGVRKMLRVLASRTLVNTRRKKVPRGITLPKKKSEKKKKHMVSVRFVVAKKPGGDGRGQNNGVKKKKGTAEQRGDKRQGKI